MSRSLSRLLLLGSLVFFSPILAQQPQPPKKEPPPKIVVVPSLGVDAGKTTKLTVRGLRLDTVTGVQLQEPKASGKLVGKGKKVGVANNTDVNAVGDSEIEIEVTVPAEVPGRTIPFALVGPGGESPPHRLLVNDETPRVAEKEPNDGFRQAQSVTLPTTIQGSVQQPQDVDVFRFEGKAGRTVQIEVKAHSFGSPLQPMLYLYDSSNQLLATAEAKTANSDPGLEFKLPRDGVYFLTLIDAHDQGGSIFVYRLHLAER